MVISRRPGSPLGSSPWWTAFSTRWLQHERWEHHAQHFWRDAQGDLQAVAEARPLQVEVGVDQADLLGHGDELPVAAEAVADEVGELHQELAGSVRVGTDEGLDRRQGVVDEVRRDLRPQETQLELHGAPAGAVELGQLQLGRDELGHLPAEPEQAGGRGGVDGDDRPDHHVVRRDGHDDAALEEARPANSHARS